MSLLVMRNIRFAFPGWPATVNGADLEVQPGAFHCLVGRSGCGKTTRLKLAAGLLTPDSGEVTFAGRAQDMNISGALGIAEAKGGLSHGQGISADGIRGSYRLPYER